MSPFDGEWRKVSVENVDAFNLATFGSEENAVKDESERFLGNLDCIESFRVRGNSTHRRSYMDGKLYADMKSMFDKEIPRKNMFGDLTVTLRRVGTHVIEKREKYNGLPEIVIVLTVDGEKRSANM